MLFQHGSVAHLGERLICIQEVEGSIPFRSTKLLITPPYGGFVIKIKEITLCYNTVMTPNY